MNEYLKPNLFLESAFEIDAGKLKEKGIKAVFFDIDNTLAPFGTDTPTSEAEALFERLKNDGLIIGILSNAGNGRSKKYAEKASVIYCGKAGKPGTRKLRRKAEELCLLPFEVTVVGDQIFTDIQCGNKFGAYTVLVKPVDPDSEPWYTHIKRKTEHKYLKRMGIL